MRPKTKNTEEPSLKKSKFLIFIFLFFLAILVVIWGWWHWANLAVSPPADGPSVISKTFIVKKGESLSSVAFRLQKAGLIRHSLAFKLIILSQGLADKIQAGSFSLKASLSPKEIAYTLTHGTSDIWLTFPEGWRKEEFAQRLSANLVNFDSSQFLQLASGHEGELFPDTYLISREASPAAVFNLLFNNFQKKFDEELESFLSKLGLTQKEALILASLVEREAKSNQDRPMVAGILIKRLKADWPLQIDATLQYALANSKLQTPGSKLEDWWPSPTVVDKKINSPYNTYKYKGLPPTPICNPGLASIEAVVYPKETDYWFYLSDASGKIHYAKTTEEHNENIRQYLAH
ncbi:endolytic transglycosylase MltG [Patescibacteria group bacterium]|nr:endolytic transglycosylase MltG [Patescibacteria group bacterium]